MSIKKFDLIIFDFDDTLFDYSATERSSLIETFKYFGLLYHNNYYDIYHELNRKIWAKLTPNSKEGMEEMRELRYEEFLKAIKIDFPSREFMKKHTSYSFNGKLIKNVDKTIKRLHEDAILVIGSNGSFTPRWEKLQNSSIKHCFSGFFVSEQFGGNIKKPNSLFFDTILKSFSNIPRERVLVVGDCLGTDILGANNAKLQSCYFTYINELTANDCNAKPDYVINDILNLLQIVYRYNDFEVANKQENKQ